MRDAHRAHKIVSTKLPILLLALLASAATAPLALAEEEPVLRVYNWEEYIGEDTLANFTKETGIKVEYDIYDSSEIVDGALMAGGSGYDLVVHAGSSIPPLLRSKRLMALDHSKLPGWENQDPQILETLATWDPGNAHGVPYMWGTTGVTYNVGMVEERIGKMPENPLDAFFKLELASKLADCGMNVLESPSDVIPMTLSYLELDPTSEERADHQAVAATFKPIRSSIKSFEAGEFFYEQLAKKELCVSMTWSGDYASVADRAQELGDTESEFAYVVPPTGSPAWFDVMMIPADAAHPENAHKFIAYLLRPEVIAEITNFTYYANANKAATALVEEEIRADSAIYPDVALLKRLWTQKELSRKGKRLRSRTWSEIKSGG